MLALRIKFTLCLVLGFSYCFSQFDFHSSNVNSLILEADPNRSNNVFTVFDNVSKISGSRVFQMGISAKSNYLIPEIKSYFVAVALPLKKESIAIGLAYNGFKLYNESIIKLAYSRPISRKIKAGISFNLIQLYVQHYKTLFLYNFDIGFSIKANHNIVLSSYISNPIPYRTSHWFNNFNYGSMVLELNYLLSDKLSISYVSSFKMEKPVQFNFGLDYNMMRVMDLLIGVSTNPILFSIGFLFNKGKLKIGTATAYHQNLGVSPQFNIQFINKNNDE